MNRLEIAKKSSIISLASQLISVVLSFFCRKVFLDTLGIEYLGLNGTLGQVIGALSISELGVQTVVIFKLYAPIVSNDRNQISKIMSAYKNLYSLVALIIIIGAIAVIPFLTIIINGVDIPFREIVICWILMAISTSLTYLLSYNGAVIAADQRQYIITLGNSILNILAISINIILLYRYRNMYIYLIVQLIYSFLSNLMLLGIRKKLYPWLRIVRVEREVYRDLLKSTKDVFAGKIAAYVFNSTDNIVISTLIGTAIVGILGNYSTVISTVRLILYAIIGPIQVILGNFLVENEKSDQREKIFINYTYITYTLICVLMIPTSVLLDDFVCIFFGRGLELSNVTLSLLIVDLYVALAQATAGNMVDAAGLFNQQKKVYYFAATINLIISCVGAIFMGINGVILGTIIGNLFCWWKRLDYTYKEIIPEAEKGKYISMNLKMGIEFGVLAFTLQYLEKTFFRETSVECFIIKGFVCVLIAAIIQPILWGRSEAFKFVINNISRKVKKI